MLGAHLGLISHSEKIRRAAQELGIPVFDSSVEAQQNKWPEKTYHTHLHRRNQRTDLRRLHAASQAEEAAWSTQPIVRMIAFSLGVFAVLALLGLYVPSATIILTPEIKTQSVILNITASQEVTDVGLSGSLPIHQTSVVVEGSKTISVTSTAIVPDEPAHGVASFYNLTTAIVSIPTGTVIRTSGNLLQRFSTTTNGVLEAGIGKTIEIPILSLAAGSAGNLPAKSLVFIEGGLGASIGVNNPEPSTGGTDRTIVTPSDLDHTRLKTALLIELRRQAIEKMIQFLERDSIILPNSITMTKKLSEYFLPAEKQPSDTLTLIVQAEFQAQYSAGEDIHALEKAALDANIPAWYEAVPATMTVTDPGLPLTDSIGLTHWQIQLARSLRFYIDSRAIAHMVQGLPLATARQRLGAIPSNQNPIVRLSPSWWPWMPFVGFRISVSAGE